MAYLLVSLAACGAALPSPTATAIPLASTATAAPRSTHPPAAVRLAESAVPTAPPSPAEPSSAALGDHLLSELDDRLAADTAEGFVKRMAAGQRVTAAGLYLTDGARAGSPGAWLAEPDPAGWTLAGATLLEIRRASASSYEARILLSWEGVNGQNRAKQPATLTLVYQRGLWLVDEIVPGERQAVAAAPTATPGRSTSRRVPQLAGKLVFQTSSGGNIYVINANGSGLRRLTDGLDPAWSPEGSRVALTRWRYPWGIYVLDGTAEERVVDGPQLKEVAWSPDGSRLAFTANRGSSEPQTICFFGFCFTLPAYSAGQIWLADLDTGDLLSLPLDDKAVHAPAWHPTGQRIVYAGDRGLAWVSIPDSAPGKEAEISRGRFENGSVWDTSPAYSPDGQRIAFMGRVHNRWEVFVMNANGSGRRQLTHSDSSLDPAPSNVAPAWSPDGEQITFLSNRDGLWRIYVMDANGAGQRPMFGDALDDLGIRYEFATERVLSWSR